MPDRPWTYVRRDKSPATYPTVAGLRRRERDDLHRVTASLRVLVEDDATLFQLHLVLEDIRRRAFIEGAKAGIPSPDGRQGGNGRRAKRRTGRRH